MGELSDRFAELMGRLAKSDADLFRTIGEQNASVRQLVDEIAPPLPLDPAAPDPTALAPGALVPAGLLPPEACELQALKARFGKLAEAQAWLEAQLGRAPKKPTWAVIAQTCRSGAWPLAPRRRGAPAQALTLTAPELEERLTALEQRLVLHLEQRFHRLEGQLALLAGALERAPRP
jgi:hypothetical protein